MVVEVEDVADAAAVEIQDVAEGAGTMVEEDKDAHRELDTSPPRTGKISMSMLPINSHQRIGIVSPEMRGIASLASKRNTVPRNANAKPTSIPK